MKRALGCLLVIPLALACMAAAPDPSERLADPAQEGRARRLMQEFRCVVCQNESIDDSEAGLAQDLRRNVREQVKAGRTDDEIRGFLVQRYGEFILLKPDFNLGNAALWLTPFALLGAAGAAFVMVRRRRERVEPLTEEEEARLAELARNGDG